MKPLQDATVYRGGSSANTLPQETCKVHLGPRRRAGQRGAVRFSFHISAAGGGETALLVDIGEQDFPALVEAMVTASPHVLPAMAAAVAQHMSKLKEHEARTQKDARQQIVGLLELSVRLAGPDNEAEQLVLKRVTKLVENLDRPKPDLKVVDGKPPG